MYSGFDNRELDEAYAVMECYVNAKINSLFNELRNEEGAKLDAAFKLVRKYLQEPEKPRERPDKDAIVVRISDL